MRNGTVAAIAVLLSLIGFTAAAELGLLEKTTYPSDNGRYLLVLKPHKNWPSHYGNCQATFFQIDKSKKRRIWTRNLLNDHAPSKAYVANSGKYILTLDEYGPRGMVVLPMVIYGSRGELINVLNLRDFLTQTEMDDHAPPFLPPDSDSWWHHELIFFSADGEVAFVRLCWGKVFAVNLSTGLVIPEKTFQKEKAWIQSQIEMLCLRKLASQSRDDRYIGAMLAGGEKIQKAIPLLRTLLTDKTFSTSYSVDAQGNKGPVYTNYIVRKAAVDALKALGVTVEGIVTEEIQK